MNPPQMKAEKSGDRTAVLEIYDLIGPSWMGMIDAKSVADALSDLGELKEVDVRISSAGGSAFEALAIYNILTQHGAEIHTRVDGVAASAASLVLMAGKTRRIPKNAMVMIHDPVLGVYGGEKDLNAGLSNLKSTKKAAIATYSTVTGLSEDVVAQMMADETWMTGDEAASKGFATTVEPEIPIAAVAIPSMTTVPPFFTKTPENFSRLVAMRATKEPKQMADPTKEVKTTEAPKTPEEKGGITPLQPTVPAVPQLTAADVAKAASDAVTAERARISEVTNLCKMAGHPELSQKYIDEGTGPGDVQKAMFSLMVAERKPVGDNSGGDQKTGDDKYKAEFAEQRDVFMQQGISEERYINSRRIDDGLQPHPATK